jgi:hypothetical protein
MFKLVKLAFVAGALAAVWMLVPVGGRTLHARWSAAASPEAFARAAWAELDRAFSGAPPAKAKAEAGGKERAGGKASLPTESHTDRDRKAVDQIVAEHLKR